MYGLFTHICVICMVSLGVYHTYMDPVGINLPNMPETKV